MPVQKKRNVVNHNYSRRTYNENGYKSFEEFYPFYLGEHCHVVNRRMHIIGTLLSLVINLYAVLTGTYWMMLVALAQGYAFAWVGHFFFEKNKPATFKHPFYSFMGDFRMLFEVLSGARAF